MKKYNANYNPDAYSRAQLDAYVKEFKDGMAKGPFLKRKLQNAWQMDEKVYFDALWQGYLDAARTFHGIGKVPKEKVVAVFDETVDKMFKKSFPEFSSQGSFDTWHADVCGTFSWLLHEKCNFAATYGMTQKVVNMALKYMYCCGYNSPYCHMPLDSYVLEWYRDAIDPEQKTAWSKLERDEYKKIQENIRAYLAKHNNLSVLENEFGIW